MDFKVFWRGSASRMPCSDFDSEELVDDDRRRSGDEWRGAVDARLAALERKIDRIDTMNESIAGMRVEMREMHTDLQQTRETVKINTEARDKDREEVLTGMRRTLEQNRMNRFQIISGICVGVMVTVISALILLAVTGSLR